MKYASLCMALALIVATCFPGQATSEPNQSDANSAAQLFEAGKFTEAGEIYAQIAAQDPKDHSAILQLGRIALLSNRLNDAQRWLEEALVLQPGDDDAKVMLAEAFYRRDDFHKAAAALSGVEVGTNRLIIEQYPTLNVAKLESFKGQTPYEVHGDGQTTRLKFLNSPSLPVVSVRSAATRSRSSSIPGALSSGSTPTLPRSLAFRNSATCRAGSPAASRPRSGSRASNRSSSATGLFGTCPS